MSTTNTAVIVNGDGMGRTDSQELRHLLLEKWLIILEENGQLPGAICFYADGVRMVCSGSPVLEQLRSLESKGVHLIVCKTCLDKFELADKMEIGIIGGMGDIVVAQLSADKVVTL